MDRQPPMIEAACLCGYRGIRSFDRDLLARELGPATNVIWAVRELIGCRNRNKMANHCRAYPVR
jgi:hypothetical protein